MIAPQPPGSVLSPHRSVLYSVVLSPVLRRIGNARFLESLPPQDARVAVPARPPRGIGVVARVRERVVDAELDAAADDVALGHVDERRHAARPAMLDAAARARLDHALERAEDLRPAVGIAAEVDRVHAEPDLRRLAHLGVPQ